jgi:hypothetical protein
MTTMPHAKGKNILRSKVLGIKMKYCNFFFMREYNFRVVQHFSNIRLHFINQFKDLSNGNQKHNLLHKIRHFTCIFLDILWTF